MLSDAYCIKTTSTELDKYLIKLLLTSGQHVYYYTITYICLTASFPGQPERANTRKVNHSGFLWSRKWWSGGGISWTICKSFAPCSRQNHASTSSLSFYRPDALPVTQPTACIL